LFLYAIFLFLTGYAGLVYSLNILAFIFFAYKFAILILGILNKEKDEIASDSLVKYCILLPVRNEPIHILDKLLYSISKINYPKELLDVKLLIDEDDDYIQEVRAKKLPSYVEIVSAKAKFPFTKPKVCNLGLSKTDAEIVTVYDAEDTPDPNQLLKVLKEFQKDPTLSCVQCRLDYTNQSQNILTGFFANEYKTWFSLNLKGLEKIQGKYPIIPLGGTSQHLKVKDLREIGSWDAFNVTEDADLGVRLARENKKIKIIESIGTR
jgi:cellulose synthase/poly-beta-1,6-N-acetylglucosamine synthase-like glycosyltransferase